MELAQQFGAWNSSVESNIGGTSLRVSSRPWAISQILLYIHLAQFAFRHRKRYNCESPTIMGAIEHTKLVSCIKLYPYWTRLVYYEFAGYFSSPAAIT